MKYIRVAAEPDPSIAPQVFQTLALSPHIEESRLLDWNMTSDEKAAFLYWIKGDHDSVGEEFEDAPAIIKSDITAIKEGEFHALLRLNPGVTSLLQDVFDTVIGENLIIDTPVIYKDGKVHATLVGYPGDLQNFLDSFPILIDVTINEVGEFRGGPSRVYSKLSERQYETVLTALEMGYYETPRQTTHKEVAEQLGCAESTVTEHLQKAETKLVKGALEEVVD